MELVERYILAGISVIMLYLMAAEPQYFYAWGVAIPSWVGVFACLVFGWYDHVNRFLEAEDRLAYFGTCWIIWPLMFVVFGLTNEDPTYWYYPTMLVVYDIWFTIWKGDYYAKPEMHTGRD